MSKPISFRTDLKTREQLYGQAKALGITTSELIDFIVLRHIEGGAVVESKISVEAPEKYVKLIADGITHKQIMAVLAKMVRKIQDLRSKGENTTEYETRVFEIILRINELSIDHDKKCSEILNQG